MAWDNFFKRLAGRLLTQLEMDALSLEINLGQRDGNQITNLVNFSINLSAQAMVRLVVEIVVSR